MFVNIFQESFGFYDFRHSKFYLQMHQTAIIFKLQIAES